MALDCLDKISQMKRKCHKWSIYRTITYRIFTVFIPFFAIMGGTTKRTKYPPVNYLFLRTYELSQINTYYVNFDASTPGLRDQPSAVGSFIKRACAFQDLYHSFSSTSQDIPQPE